MRIGLARHFLVPHSRAQYVDSDGFTRWIAWYDEAEGVAPEVIAPGDAWDVCYCSDLPRAQLTAQRLHAGRVECTPLLREVPFAPAFRFRMPMPLYVWQALARAGWWLGHAAQTETRSQTANRAAGFLDTICAEHADKTVLIVGHGFLMHVLARELERRGFRGRLPLRPLGGRVYVFER